MTDKPTAPERIWLTNGDDINYSDDSFRHDGAYWCADSVNDNDVEYIRADLAHPADPGMPEQEWLERHAQIIDQIEFESGMFGKTGATRHREAWGRLKVELRAHLFRRVAVDRNTGWREALACVEALRKIMLSNDLISHELRRMAAKTLIAFDATQEK